VNTTRKAGHFTIVLQSIQGVTKIFGHISRALHSKTNKKVNINLCPEMSGFFF
jgi:hypothetical protein